MARLRPGDHTVRFNLALMLMQTGKLNESLYHAWIAVYGVSPDKKVRLQQTDAFFRHRVDKDYLLGLILQRPSSLQMVWLRHQAMDRGTQVPPRTWQAPW